MSNTTTSTTTKANAPHWMDSEGRFRFWERNGISDHDRSKQIAITLAAYADVPQWELQDAKERFVSWCDWFSDFCSRVNRPQPANA